MRVLVTGSEGLVGGRLLPRLEKAGCDAWGCDRDVDVADPAALATRVAAVQPEAVIHLAAISATRNPRDDPAEIYRINFGGAAALFAAVETHVPRARVLFVSSGLVYGRLPTGAAAFDERAPLRPRGAYAWTKAAADRLGAEYATAGLDLVRVRPFNHTGPGRRADFVESRLALQLARIEAGLQEPVVRVHNLEAVRDFLSVDDVVEAYLQLLDPAVPPGVYNIASGVGRSIREVWQRLLAHSRVRPDLEAVPEAQDASDRSIGDSSRLRTRTGWEPRDSLDATLGALLEFWRDELRSSPRLAQLPPHAAGATRARTSGGPKA